VAPQLLGWKGGPTLPIETLHPVEFHYEMVSSGRIKIDPSKKIKGPVTIQDPCNLIRLRGAADKLRYLVHEMCEEVVEMYPNREHNFCCNAGGGGAAIGQPWKSNRVEGSRVKAEQIIKTGAKYVCAPCHNCYTAINDTMKAYDIKAKAFFMDELIANTMVIPEEFKAGA
jgi:Fe-S oxidoreductase